jgi:hypothetical protein
MEENAKFCVVHITVRFTFLWNGWHVINIYAKQKRAENASLGYAVDVAVAVHIQFNKDLWEQDL